MTCYCKAAKSFRTAATFVLLIHPKEARKRIGTARILRLCIQNAFFKVGHGEAFDRDEEIQAWVEGPEYDPFVLFPGPRAIHLDRLSEGMALFDSSKTPVIFVIDGTWHQARIMLRDSQVLSSLRQLVFTPEAPSNYRIREQPQEFCVSSLEAVHALIDRLDRMKLSPAPEGRAHDNLLEVFSVMVDRQIAYEKESRLRRVLQVMEPAPSRGDGSNEKNVQPEGVSG